MRQIHPTLKILHQRTNRGMMNQKRRRLIQPARIWWENPSISPFPVTTVHCTGTGVPLDAAKIDRFNPHNNVSNHDLSQLIAQHILICIPTTATQTLVRFPNSQDGRGTLLHKYEHHGKEIFPNGLFVAKGLTVGKVKCDRCWWHEPRSRHKRVGFFDFE